MPYTTFQLLFVDNWFSSGVIKWCSNALERIRAAKQQILKWLQYWFFVYFLFVCSSNTKKASIKNALKAMMNIMVIYFCEEKINDR